ncbi:sporulation protein [Halalkalibacter urbisdiaboli]|uniref:sporulation protein n=1 Tax=Halalkalibacter urbisdiaboli TaxID=1960589 RepID=UPI000B440213|nr:sporulation protein [Halalkalibacter urbisdiaboli]
MDSNLGYLRESLSNHLEHHELCQRIYDRIENNSYKDEEEFVRDLNENEIMLLNLILRTEIGYAKQEQDEKRERQLSDVYELLI